MDQTYKWKIRLDEPEDWEVEMLEPIITVDMIIEIIEYALSKKANFIILDYCSLTEDPNQNGGFSIFQDMDAINAVMDKYGKENNVFIHLDF